MSFDVVGPTDGYIFVSLCSKLPTTLQRWNEWGIPNLVRWLSGQNADVVFPNWSRGHGNTHRSNGSVMNAPMGGQFRSKNETKIGWDSLDDTDLNTNPAEQTIASTAAGDTSSNIPGSVQIEIYNNGKNSRISSQFGNITVSNITDEWEWANVTEWYLLIMLSRTDMEINNLYWGEYPPPSGFGSGSG